MAEYPMRFGRSLPEWGEQRPTEIAPVGPGPENLRVAHLNTLNKKSRPKTRLAASQTKGQRSQIKAEHKQAKAKRKIVTRSKKKEANSTLPKGIETLTKAERKQANAEGKRAKSSKRKEANSRLPTEIETLTKAERKQANAEGKKAKSSKKKEANSRLSEGIETLVPARDEERVTNLELAIFHVFANKQLALDALDLRDKQGSTYRLAVVGDFLLLLAPADKWMETNLTRGQWMTLRSSIEQNAQLAEHCVKAGLHKLALGCMGSTHQLGTIVEAVLAAVYYDTNKSLDAVRGVMRSLQIMDTVDAHLHRKNVTAHTTKARKGQTKWKRSKAVTSPPGVGEVMTVEISDDEDVDVMMDDWEDEDGHEESEQDYERSTAQLEKEVAAELRQLLV